MRGVLVVARHEFRLRIRAGRWRTLLGIWFLVLLGFTSLLYDALDDAGSELRRGAVMYGGLMLFLLALALLVVPALASQSVNGDRERGILATLQVTRLTPTELALGKFVAAWGTALVFLAVSMPLVLWCMTQGGVPLTRVLVVTLVVAVLLGTVVAISLALSALLSRTTTSSVLAYLGVFTLTVGTVVLFGLVTAVTAERTTERACYTDPNGQQVCEGTFESTRARTDLTWPLLAPNPFVVLADSAPDTGRFGFQEDEGQVELDPLGALGETVRQARKSPGEEGPGGPLWPTGLAIDLAIGAAALVVTRQRLVTPSRTLARGQRVA